MTKYDPDECERLAGRARSFSSSSLAGYNGMYGFELWSVADQLDAARLEIGSLEAERNRLCVALRDALSFWRMPPETAEEKALRDQIWSLAFPSNTGEP